MKWAYIAKEYFPLRNRKEICKRWELLQKWKEGNSAPAPAIKETADKDEAADERYKATYLLQPRMHPAILHTPWAKDSSQMKALFDEVKQQIIVNPSSSLVAEVNLMGSGVLPSSAAGDSSGDRTNAPASARPAQGISSALSSGAGSRLCDIDVRLTRFFELLRCRSVNSS